MISLTCRIALMLSLSLSWTAISLAQEYTCERSGGANRWTLRCEVTDDDDNEPSSVWSRQGTGPRVVAIPNRVRTVRITGHNQGRSSENFVIWCGRDTSSNRGGLWVNEILRGGQRYRTTVYNEREYNGRGNPCGRVTVKHSTDVRWTLTQQEDARSLVSPRQPSNPALDELDVLRNRQAVLNELLRDTPNR